MSLQLLLFLVWLAVGYPSGAAVRGPDRSPGAVRLAAIARWHPVPDAAVLDGLEDGADPVDGIRHRPAVHRAGAGARFDHRGRRAGVRGGRAGLTVEVRIRLFAMQRQQLGWRDRPLELPDGVDHGDAWTALVASHAELGIGGGQHPFRPQRRLRGHHRAARRRRRAGSHPARRGGSAESYRRIELSPDPFPDALLLSCGHAVSSSADGAVVLFLGQTRETAGTRRARPGGRRRGH